MRYDLRVKIPKSIRLPLVIGLLMILSIPSILPLLHAGFFGTDDGEWMIIRFTAFYQALQAGQFPVRFVEQLNFGYGYPVVNFLYPGFLYLALPIKMLGFGFVSSIKILLLLCMLTSSLFTFLWLRKIFDEKASIVGALFYLYAPYHLYDLYRRGSVGEILALSIVPFTLWMFEKKNIFFSSIAIFLLIISHNTLAVLFIPLLFLYAYLRKLFSIKLLFTVFAFGILMASFFIVPIITELSLTRFSATKISDATDFFAALSLVGYSSVFVFVFSLFLFIKNKKQSYRSLVAGFLILGIVSLFLSTSFSSFLWSITPSSFIQFPFRILSLLILTVSFLAGYSIFQANSKIKTPLIALLLVLLVYSSFEYSQPKGYIDRDDSYYYTNDSTTTVMNEYLPLWVKEQSTNRPDKKVEVIKGSGQIISFSSNSKRVEVNVLDKIEILRINILYYPGWKAYIDGKETKIDYSNKKGVMDIQIPNGTRTVELLFEETLIRKAANSLSVFTFLVLIGFSIFKNRVYRPKKI